MGFYAFVTGRPGVCLAGGWASDVSIWRPHSSYNVRSAHLAYPNSFGWGIHGLVFNLDIKSHDIRAWICVMGY